MAAYEPARSIKGSASGDYGINFFHSTLGKEAGKRPPLASTVAAVLQATVIDFV